MAALQVLSAPTNTPTLTGVVNKPSGLPTAPLKVAPPAPTPAKLPVVSKPTGVQQNLSVQPLPAQPSIYVPPKPPEAPQMDKIASDIGVARGRGADDTTILYTLVKKNPALTEPVKVAIQERKATPSQVLDAIVAKHQTAQESKEKWGVFDKDPATWGVKDFLSPAKDVVVGAGKNFAQVGNFLLKPLDKAYEKVTGKKAPLDVLTDEDLKAKGVFQHVGKITGDILQQMQPQML